MGNRWITYSFIAHMPITCGRLCSAFWVYLGLCLDPGELLACWYGGVWCHTTASIWSAIPHCIMWTIWREWNNQTFEGEQSITELKHIFILSLFEWITAFSGLRISSLLDFLDLCSFEWHFVSLCTLPVYQGSCFCCTTIFFFNKVFYLPIKNK